MHLLNNTGLFFREMVNNDVTKKRGVNNNANPSFMGLNNQNFNYSTIAGKPSCGSCIAIEQFDTPWPLNI